MNRFQSSLTNANDARQLADNRGKKYWLAVPIVVAALVLIFTAQAQSPPSDTVLACSPNATARLTALRSQDVHRVGTLKLKAKGLLPNTDFTVFLSEGADASFTAANYLGEMTTNADGRGSMHADALIDAAFSNARNAESKPARKDLNQPVLRFTNSTGADVCFTPVIQPSSLFRGDGQAEGKALFLTNGSPGRTASVATTLIREPLSMDGDASLIQTMNWRFMKCFSAF